MEHAILTGDLVDILPDLKSSIFDGILSDPPYGIGFMGKAWDASLPSDRILSELLRVLKPGAHAVFFGSPRTHHRLMVALEDAGFETRDVCMWIYGQGFPKSRNVSLDLDAAAGVESQIVGTQKLTGTARTSGGRAGTGSTQAAKEEVVLKRAASELGQSWHGYGTALKPAWEPAVIVRKPLEGTLAQNIAKWGTGAINVDGCRVGGELVKVAAKAQPRARGKDASASFGVMAVSGHVNVHEGGRWPANVLHDGELGAETIESLELGSSKFFYSAKVSTSEREAGCKEIDPTSVREAIGRDADSVGAANARATRTGGKHNPHPTLKPLSLTEYFARMITPPGGQASILVPFSGAGSEMIGALKAGAGFVVGVELDPHYCQIAAARVAHWCPDSQLSE